MSAEPLTCPYCNAFVSLPPNAHDGQRVTCSRCGDAFPLRGMGTGIKVPGGVAPTQAAPGFHLAGTSLTTSARSLNRLDAGLYDTVMALIATYWMTWAMHTQA